ncbi:Cellulosome-anchoring protein precursor [compost metagenome]
MNELKERIGNNQGPSQLSDISSHWGRDNIVLFARMGFLTGYPDGTFKPDGNITRAEFAVIVSKIFSLQSSTDAAVFSDVGQHWAQPFIASLVTPGVINGYGDGTFRPNQNISRAEIIAIISRLVELKDGTASSFSDTRGYWNEDQINAAFQAGLIQGRTLDHFAPASSSTRAEAITIILRSLELDPAIKDLLSK